MMKLLQTRSLRHREEQSDVAIQIPGIIKSVTNNRVFDWIASQARNDEII